MMDKKEAFREIQRIAECYDFRMEYEEVRGDYTSVFFSQELAGPRMVREVAHGGINRMNADMTVDKMWRASCETARCAALVQALNSADILHCAG